MNNSLFIDTWGWLTLYDKKEKYHQEVVTIYQDFLSKQGIIYTTDYVLDETFTLFFKRLNNFQAQRGMESLLNAFQDNRFQLIFIDKIKFELICAMRLKYSDKPLISFTDLSSMLVMKEYKIGFVLSGDDHFNQVGMNWVKFP